MDKTIVLSDAASEAVIKLQKARTALRTTINEYDLCNTNMDIEDGKYLVYNIESICNMLEIVDDYMLDANRKLEQALA